MIYRHKTTGMLYRKLFDSFNVERQYPSVVYVGLDSGCVFDRSVSQFMERFEFVCDAQSGIEPKASRS